MGRDDPFDADGEVGAVAKLGDLALAAGRQAEGGFQDLRRETLELTALLVHPWAVMGPTVVAVTPAFWADSARLAPPWWASS